MIRGLSLVKNTRSLKDNLPLVASVSATAYILTRGSESERPSGFERPGKLTAVILPKCDRIIHVQSRVVSHVAMV